MRKYIFLTAFISGIFFLFLAKGGYATPLIVQGGTNTIGAYTIYDNSTSTNDIWDSTIGGYFFNTTSKNADYTGFYIGTVAGNDGSTALTYLASYFLDQPVTITQDGKVDSPNTSNGDLTITYNSGGMSGTWSVSSTSLYDFYVVKGSNEYAIYYLNPAVSSGDWVTYHLLTGQVTGNGSSQTPGISHLSVYDDPAAPVPEPGTIVLFGGGLLGLAGFFRRRINS